MIFRFLTAGESHGRSLVGIIEGIPANLDIDFDEIDKQLKRRKMGYGRGSRQKIESDEMEILTGVRHGKTLGSPLTMVIWNKDFKNWTEIMSVTPIDKESPRQVHIPRPGHADYIGGKKYDQTDMRNILERASARETAMRVGLGCVARQFLQSLGIEIASRVVSIGGVHDSSECPKDIRKLNDKLDESPLRVLGEEACQEMIQKIDEAKNKGDSVGGVFEVICTGLPLGLGSYIQWDKRLEGNIAKSFMSLNAIKGVEVGLGFESAHRFGSEVHDEMELKDNDVCFRTNKTGGIVGGMSSGEPIVIKAAMKPIATLMKPLDSVDLKAGEMAKAHVERADYCAVPAAAVIGESLLALTLAESILTKFGGDSMKEVKTRLDHWRAD